MPKSAVIDEDETKGAKVHFAAGENGINEALLKGYVAEIDDEQAKIDEIYAEADRCGRPHGLAEGQGEAMLC